MDNFIELLITQVQERPILWNKFNFNYKNRILVNKEWIKVAKAANFRFLVADSKDDETRQTSSYLYIFVVLAYALIFVFFVINILNNCFQLRKASLERTETS